MNEIYNVIGLAAKARKVISGESMVVESIRKKEAKLVLIANDCMKNTRKKIINKCEYYDIDYIILEEDRYCLGRAIGKESRVCLAIIDSGFAKLVMKKKE